MLKTLRTGWERLSGFLLAMDDRPSDHVFERLRALEGAVARIEERQRKSDAAGADDPARA